MYAPCSPHLNIVLTLPYENEPSHVTLRTTPAASNMVWNIKFIEYRENKLIVTEYVQFQNVRLVDICVCSLKSDDDNDDDDDDDRLN